MKAFLSLLIAHLGLVFAFASDYTDSVLTHLQGVGLEVRPLNVQSDLFNLSQEDVQGQALKALQDLDVRVLSSAEQDVMPGQPYLDVSIDVAHAQGPSHLFVVRLELREMAQLERPKDKVVSMALPTWERKIMGVANRPEAVVEAMQRLLKVFADEYHTMNPPKEG